MAGFKERISLIVDLDSKAATSGLKSFQTSVRDAEGFSGKLKAGVSSLTSTFTSFIKTPQGAAVALGAAAAAAGKLASEASDLGIKIGKLSDATGLSAEDASRWTEVAEDMGIGAEGVAGLIEKMTVNLGKSPDKFDALGISVKRAADGTVDMNATLLTAIERIDGITDPTEKAKVAASLFGKSWAQASELVGMGADKVKKKLDAVGDAKIYSEDQVKDSRDFRDAIADVKDIGEDLAITFGKSLMPAIVNLLHNVTPVVDKFGDLVEILGDVGFAAQQETDAHGNSVVMLKYLEDEVGNLVSAETLLEESHRAVANATKHARAEHEDAAKAADDLAKSERGLSGDTRKAKEAMEGAATATGAMERAYSQLTGKLDDREAWLNLLDDVDAYIAKQADASLTDREREQSTIAMKQSMVEYTATLTEIPVEKRTAVLALIDQNKLYEAQVLLDELTKARDLIINPKLGKGAAGSFVIVPGSKYAAGTENAKAGVALVGEQGPELVMMNGGEKVVPAGRTASMLSGRGAGGTNVNISVVVGPGGNPAETGRHVADALAAYYRNGGQRP